MIRSKKIFRKSLNSVVKEKKYIFSDLFAGTGIVGRYFKEKGHRVIANDLQYYSFVLNKNYIENHKILSFWGLEEEIPELFVADLHSTKEIVLDYLNNLEWKKGFIYKNYSPSWTKWQEFERMYFSDENALKCDGIRNKIEQWKKDKKITENEYYFLLASLLESIDKVANTASVYGAFLKKFKKSAQNLMILKPADFYLNDNEHQVFNKNINDLILESSHDVVYLDPPYNHRQYWGNYHILETIAKWDNPKITWKTWMRIDPEKKSDYCKKWEVKKSFRELIKNIDAKYIFMSYNCEWLLSHQEIKEIMETRWEYWVFTKEYRRFKAWKDRNFKKDSVLEYLHYVKIK